MKPVKLRNKLALNQELESAFSNQATGVYAILDEVHLDTVKVLESDGFIYLTHFKLEYI